MARIAGLIRKYRSFIILFLIFALAVAIRCLFLNNFIFGYEQGRDAQVAEDILHLKKFPLIGPKTDIDGIFHGAGYYYFISILYFLGRGSPLFVLLCLLVLNAASVFFVYKTTFLILKDKALSYCAALIYSLSFSAIIYSQWLSNVSPSIFLTSVFVYLMVAYLKTKKFRHWVLLFTVLGLLFHFELLHGLYGIFAVAVTLLMTRQKVSLKMAISAFVILSILCSPFLFFELRHQFIMTKSILGYAGKGNQGTHGNLFIYFRGLAEDIGLTLFPLKRQVLYALLFILTGTSVLYLRKSKTPTHKEGVIAIVVFLVWSIPYIFLIKEFPLEHFYAGTLIPTIILLVILVRYNFAVIRSAFYIALPIWIVFNGFFTVYSLKNTFNIFYHGVQYTFRYKDEIALLDYVFTYSDQSFHYDAFTIPYYHKNGWDYLYEWVGKKRHESMYDLNNRTTSYKDKKYIFLIIEPATEGYWLNKWIAEYKEKSTFIEHKNFGAIQLIIAKNDKQ